MKRMLKLMARLYPSGWRKRYGAEYEALLEDSEPHARDVADVLWEATKMRLASRTFVRIVLPCALAGALVGVGFSLSRPAMYHSRTLITVDADSRVSLDSGLRELVQGAFPASFLDQIIQRENLYPRERERMPMSEVVSIMRKDIWLRPLQKNDGKPAMAFVVEFYYPDPHVAQRVDAELVSQMVALNVRIRIEQAQANASHVWEVFRVVKTANLPKRPDGWGQAGFGVVGALGGLVAGMIAATALGSREPAVS
jgi:hypothetical protein